MYRVFYNILTILKIKMSNNSGSTIYSFNTLEYIRKAITIGCIESRLPNIKRKNNHSLFILTRSARMEETSMKSINLSINT